MTGRLVVHTAREVIEVPLTGDAKIDALLERFCKRGGAVLREGASIASPSLQTSALDDHGDAWEPAP